MELNAETVAVFSLLLLFAVDRVMGFLKSRGVDLLKMARQIDRLDELHAKTDEDGVPVWYVRRSLEKVLIELGEAIRHQTELLGQLTQEIKETRRDVLRWQAELSPD
ncbi:MAG TPA: hypothetical protein VMY37_35810 [Thermoguttaceae bacterium]|nr:hypothetical protein [Thermoguttaceae bacterium]